MPKWLNTNSIHNAINILITLIAGLETFDWTPFMTESTAMKVVGGLAMSKLLINAVRDGITGMASQQPPVKS